MHIKYFFFILFTTILFSCSSESSEANEQEQENEGETEEILKIKKVTSTNNFNDTSITYFNKDGTTNKFLFLFNDDPENESPYYLNEYDDQQNLTAIKIYSTYDEFIRDLRTYSYNDSGQLIAIIDYGDTTQPPYTTTFTYQDNRVDFSEESTNKSGYLVFNSDGKIIETAHDKNGTGFFKKHFLTYENNRLVEIRTDDYNNIIYSFSTDENVNPLFRDFQDRPLQYFIHEHYTYDIDFTGSYYHFQNNPTQINWDSGFPNQPIFETTTYQYNSDNLPVSSEIERYDGTTKSITYEYY